jgi:hypothetical protein
LRPFATAGSSCKWVMAPRSDALARRTIHCVWSFDWHGQKGSGITSVIELSGGAIPKSRTHVTHRKRHHDYPLVQPRFDLLMASQSTEAYPWIVRCRCSLHSPPRRILGSWISNLNSLSSWTSRVRDEKGRSQDQFCPTSSRPSLNGIQD